MPAVYYSVSPFGTGNLAVACNISIAGGAGAATFSVAQTGNIGVGCHVISANTDGFISEMTDSTHATIVTATGSAHGNVSSETLTSVAHEYASLSAFEAGFTDANHINNTDLTAAGASTNAFAPCYYDHDDSTFDTTRAVINYGTDDATYYLKVYTPQGGTESINDQHHDGKRNANKYMLSVTDNWCINSQEGYDRFEGLQIELLSPTANGYDCIEHSVSGKLYVDRCILIGPGPTEGTYNQAGIQISAGDGEIRSTIIYDQGNRSFDQAISNTSAGTINIENVTIHSSYYGVRTTAGTVNATNVGVVGANTAFSGTITQTTCSSSTPTFVNEGADDFHLASGDSTWKGQGTATSLTYDIDGDSWASPPSIGADEPLVVAAGIEIFRRRIEGY